MSVNITLDDTSPMIIWGDGWEIGSLNSGEELPRLLCCITSIRILTRACLRIIKDPFTPRYYGSTFRCTQTEAASGSIKFKGSGVWLYGAKRDNHGVFEVDLDGQVATLDGYDVVNVPQVMLFGQGGLDPTVEHTVVSTSRADSSTTREKILRLSSAFGACMPDRNSPTRLPKIKARRRRDPGWISTSSS